MKGKQRTAKQERRRGRDRKAVWQLVDRGDLARAEEQLRRLLAAEREAAARALLRSDLAVVLSAQGREEQARLELAQALLDDPTCEPARRNLSKLGDGSSSLKSAPDPAPRPEALRIAIIGLLFNWITQATGGGCVHTVGLAQALARDGHRVKHFYARCTEAGLGAVEPSYPLDGQAIEFDPTTAMAVIGERFREAAETFAPDLVIVTDSWSSKPHLVEAMQGYPVLMRFDSQECLCPLNNCRFLFEGGASFRQCPDHRLAKPENCQRCLQERGAQSGPLHQFERELAGAGAPEHVALVRRALQQAEAVTVNNPLIAECLKPYARLVKVIPPAVDANRFPWRDEGGPDRDPAEPKVIFMAGAVEERFKGFATLHEACSRLWRKRQDFRLVATGSDAGRENEFTEFTGWLSQGELPGWYRRADICVVPSWVQDSWGIVAVEAMAAGRPVVTSRIGGLQLLVTHETTGLLCEAGDADELAAALDLLLSDVDLRRSMGRAGRRRFEESGSWEAVMERHYRPLLRQFAGARAGAHLAGKG
jgi:glycosyltransferase involved in cell wall biosynthesis